MFKWYGALAVSSILKETVEPWLTLMSVANPWIVGSPAPGVSQTLWGVPGSWFSATIGFTEKRSRSSRLSTNRRNFCVFVGRFLKNFEERNNFRKLTACSFR